MGRDGEVMGKDGKGWVGDGEVMERWWRGMGR